MARRYAPYHRAGPSTIFLQVIKSQCEDLVGSQPGAILIHNAKPVGVTVQAEADLPLAAADEFAHLGHAFRIRLGMMPAKQRIRFVMKNGDFSAGVFK